MKSEMHDKDTKVHEKTDHPRKTRGESCKCKGDCPCCDEKEGKEEKASEGKRKVIVASAIALLMAAPAMAQDATASRSFWADPFHHPMLPLYAAMTLLAITIVLVLATMIYLVRVIKFLLRQGEIEKAKKAGVEYVAPPSMIARIWQDLNDAVPVAKEQDIDLGHSYDGIRELDNHLPPWWKGLFYASIIWGIGYLVVYHVTDSLPLSINEYENELASADENARLLKASKPVEVIDENTLVFTPDADLISKGKIVFTSNNCGSCHRADGGGSTIGPNLTDDYWIHGGNVKNVFSTIKAGVVEKGMPAWGKVMSASDVRNVAFYVMSLRGSNPKDAKAPQGELYKPEEAPVRADSTTAIAN